MALFDLGPVNSTPAKSLNEGSLVLSLFTFLPLVSLQSVLVLHWMLPLASWHFHFHWRSHSKILTYLSFCLLTLYLACLLTSLSALTPTLS